VEEGQKRRGGKYRTAKCRTKKQAGNCGLECEIAGWKMED